MSELDLKELLKKREVIEEIERHKWFVSERVGYDVGFASAAEEWLMNFSAAWIAYNMPAQVKNLPPELKAQASATPAVEVSAKSKRRKAKSYLSR